MSHTPRSRCFLVSPTNTYNLDFFDAGFNEADSIFSGVNLNFYDSAGQYTNSGDAPTAGNYEASDDNELANIDTFGSTAETSYDSSIPQVPVTVNYAYNNENPSQTRGPVTETFQNNFNGAPANGTWALYAYQNDAVNETIAGGWCIALNTGVSTTTTVTSSKGDQTTGQPVTLTATVTSGGNPVTSGGTVTFLENGAAPPGTVSGNNVVTLNGSGQATFTTSALPEGDNKIVAEYSGDSSDSPSQATFWQRIDDATSVIGSGETYQYCNSGKIAISANTGPFTPNPSNIFVTNLPGTVNSTSLTLENFSTESESIYAHESLVEGPTGAALDFFSNVGNSGTILSEGNYTFSDSASTLVPQTNFVAGSYKPTSYANIDSTADLFYSSSSPSSSSPFYPAPTSFGYAAVRGSATFGSTFGDTNPNGTWSLFFDTLETATETDANGWCLNFTENRVTVSVDLNHQGDGIGTDFVEGETGAQITTVVQASNTTGSTGDPLGTNPLTVVDTLNSALTYTGYSGSGWTCTAPPATSITCTNDSAVAEGASYPTLILNVNVASNAPPTISNSVNVSGAGITAVNDVGDTITVDPTPILSVSKSHTGTFTQGSTGQWNIAVSNTAARGATAGTVTVSDALPSGYTLASYTSTSSLWTCSGTGTVTCTATPGIAGGSSSTINLTVNIPASSPTSVSNTALAWGGGDSVHNTLGTAAVSNTDTVSVGAAPAITSANAASFTSVSGGAVPAKPMITRIIVSTNWPVTV